LISGILNATPMQTLAQMPTWSNLEKVGSSGDDVATIGSLASVFSNIMQAIMAVSGIVLFVMLVIGGFNFLFSSGDQKKLEKAKGTVTNAIVGLVVLVCAYLILFFIKTFTGVDVTTFKLELK